VLRVAGGDGERALHLLSDPDALQAHPEVARLFAEQAAAVGEADEKGEEEDGEGGGFHRVIEEVGRDDDDDDDGIRKNVA